MFAVKNFLVIFTSRPQVAFEPLTVPFSASQCIAIDTLMLVAVRCFLRDTINGGGRGR